MDRREAQIRLAAAILALLRKGWTAHQIDALTTGLYRDEAVEAAERALEVANG